MPFSRMWPEVSELASRHLVNLAVCQLGVILRRLLSGAALSTWQSGWLAGRGRWTCQLGLGLWACLFVNLVVRSFSVRRLALAVGVLASGVGGLDRTGVCRACARSYGGDGWDRWDWLGC
jgi:hypothetical protein